MTSTTSSATSSIARTAALLALVLVGLVTVGLMFLWPLLFIHNPSPLLVHVPLIAGHIVLLIFCDPYLYIHRKAFYPIRYLLMPLVIEIAKSEAIQENTPTWYITTEDFSTCTTRSTGMGDSNGIDDVSRSTMKDATGLLQSLPKRVRREIRRKLKNYERRGITTTTKHCDHLSLYKDMPVLWNHERKSVRGMDGSIVAEFTKRFLVIFLTTSGYIDRYYVGVGDDQGGAQNDNDQHSDGRNGNGASVNEDDKNLVALSLFVGQGNVLHTLMYFCKEEENESGIWFYQHFRMILRATACKERSDDSTTRTSPNTNDIGTIGGGEGLNSPLLGTTSEEANILFEDEDNKLLDYQYVNFHVHQDFAKKCVGAKPASCTDDELMRSIYPFAFFHKPPQHTAHASFKLEDAIYGDSLPK